MLKPLFLIAHLIPIISNHNYRIHSLAKYPHYYVYDSTIKSFHAVTFEINDTNFQAQDYDNNRLQFIYLDSLGIERNLDLNHRNSKLTIKEPLFLTEYNYSKTPFFLYPGEHINVSLSEEKNLLLKIKGNYQRNSELKVFTELIDKTEILFTEVLQSRPLSIKEISLKEIQISILKNNRYYVLDSLNKQSPFSEKFLTASQNIINSLALQDSLYLYWNNKNIFTEDKSYSKILLQKAISLNYFIDFKTIYFLRNWDHITNVLLSEKPKIITKTLEYFTSRFEFIQKNTTGSLRDYLLYRNFNIANSNAVMIPESYVRRFKTVCTNKEYINIIEYQIKRQKLILVKSRKKDLLSTSDNTIFDLQNIFDKYKGKLILIDFWASWCYPCRKEIPYSTSLRNQLSNKKIQFIYVSLDRDFDNWKLANETENLPIGNSFVFLNKTTSTFIKKYKVNEIPRYMLFSKMGKLLELNLPRPSDSTLLPIINKYIN